MGLLRHGFSAGESETVSTVRIWVELPKEAGRELQYPSASFISAPCLCGCIPLAVLCDAPAKASRPQSTVLSLMRDSESTAVRSYSRWGPF